MKEFAKTMMKMTFTQQYNYPIIRSHHILDCQNPLLRQVIGEQSFLIFVSPSVNRFYGDEIKQYLAHHFSDRKREVIEVSTGELNKSISTVMKLCSIVNSAGLDRRTVFIGIGGGVLTDIVAFAASIYRRQSSCLRIGTTLVGQVDASVGIKCGVNLNNSKNIIGSYHPSLAVLVDPHFLTTLPSRHIRCGIAEIIKLAVMKDIDLFALVEQHWPAILSYQVEDPQVLEIIDRAIKGMIAELASNPYEANTKRIVDFGHTFSPYIETASDYRIHHGEAVSIDMALSSHLAFQMGYLSQTDLSRILDLMTKIRLPLFDTILDAEKLHDSLGDIVRHRGLRLNMPIPTSIGSAAFIETIEYITLSSLQKAIAYLHAASYQ